MTSQENGEVLAAMRERMPKWCRDGFLAGYRGSRAHGTYVPPNDPTSIDDIDVFTVFVHRPEWYLSLEAYHSNVQRNFATDGEELDIVAYDIQKFIDLLMKGNPNVHTWLWLRPIDYLVTAGPAFYLMQNRTGFLSQRVLHAFAGYARSQFARMQRFEYHGRMGQKRKALVDQHGYDCKNAAHLIRLLTMGTEVAQTGTLQVFRKHDRHVLIEIKSGQWTLEKVKEYADGLWADFEKASADCDLPETVDRQFANRILAGCMERHWELTEDG